jgi:hypothetical protein
LNRATERKEKFSTVLVSSDLEKVAGIDTEERFEKAALPRV